MTFDDVLEAFQKEYDCAKRNCPKEIKQFKKNNSPKIQSDFNNCKIQHCSVELKNRLKLQQTEIKAEIFDKNKKLILINTDRNKIQEKKVLVDSINGSKTMLEKINKTLKKKIGDAIVESDLM